jgi:hypothetical protein
MASTAKQLNPETSTPTRHPARPAIAATFRLFELCEKSKNPANAFARACNKVGWLCRSGQRPHLFWLVSALNDAKHAHLAERYGNPSLAAFHRAESAQCLKDFQRTVARLALAGAEPEPSEPDDGCEDENTISEAFEV